MKFHPGEGLTHTLLTSRESSQVKPMLADAGEFQRCFKSEALMLLIAQVLVKGWRALSTD